MNYENSTLLRLTGEKLPLIPMPSGKKYPSIKWKLLRNEEPMSYRENLSDSNVALLTGNTPYYNFIAFDFDCYGNNEATENAKRMIEQNVGAIPWEEAYLQTTPSGGVHYIFQTSQGISVKSTTDLLKDKTHCVDIRAEGGLLVLAPSKAVSKVTGEMQPYLHTNGIELENTAVLDIETCHKLNAYDTTNNVDLQCSTGTQPAQKVTTQTSNFFEEAISRCLSNLVMTSEGSRNNELNRQSFQLGTFVGAGVLPYKETHSMLVNIATSMGLSWKESNNTVTSGLQAGTQHPIQLTDSNHCSPDWFAKNQIESNWNKPLVLEAPLSPVLSLSEDMLPKDMYAYSIIKARKLDNAPPEFIAVALLVAYAATLGTTHVIQPKSKDKDWNETPVLWGGIIAPPSAKKTPCMSVALKPLKFAQKYLTKKYQNEVKKMNVKSKLYEKRAKNLEEQAHKVFEEGDEEAASDLLQQSEEIRAQIVKPVERKIMVNDATVEALGVRLGGTDDGVLMMRDELSGLLVDFKDERSSARPFYLEAYNGSGEYTIERITRAPVFIKRHAVWVLGGIQPDKLLPFLHARKHGGDNDGFLERMQLLVMPDIPESQYVDESTDIDETFLVTRIEDQFLRAAKVGFDENGLSHIVRFDSNAQQSWATWMQQHSLKVISASKDMQPVLGKQPGVCARIALIFHIFEGNAASDLVSATTLDKAIRFLEFLESHQYRIFGSCEKTLLHEHSQLFLEKIKGLPNPFTISDVSDKKWAVFGKDNRDVVLQNLCDNGYLLRIQDKNKKGRPTILYYKHPEYCGV